MRGAAHRSHADRIGIDIDGQATENPLGDHALGELTIEVMRHARSAGHSHVRLRYNSHNMLIRWEGGGNKHSSRAMTVHHPLCDWNIEQRPECCICGIYRKAPWFEA